MEQFFITLVGALIGASVSFAFMPSRRRPLSAAVVEIIGLTLAFALPGLVFFKWPELYHGRQRITVTVVLILVIYLPASWWAERIRASQ
jgi:hypothetical protein